MDVEEQLRRLAEARPARGADAVWAAAEQGSQPGMERRRSVRVPVLAAAAAVAVAVASAVAVTPDRDGQAVTVGSPTSEAAVPTDEEVPASPSSTVAEAPAARLPEPVVVYEHGGGLVRLSPDGDAIRIGSVPGGAGRSHVAVDPSSGAVYVGDADADCSAEVNRIGSGGDGEVVATDGATAPAPNGAGSLAYVEAPGCTSELGRVIVRDLEGGAPLTYDLDAADGPALQPVDVAWTSPTTVAVLAAMHDGTITSHMLIEYEVTATELVFTGRQAYSEYEIFWSSLTAIDGDRLAVAQWSAANGPEATEIVVVGLPPRDAPLGTAGAVVETLGVADGAVFDLLVSGEGTLVYTVLGETPPDDRLLLQQKGRAPEMVGLGRSGLAWAPA